MRRKTLSDAFQRLCDKRDVFTLFQAGQTKKKKLKRQPNWLNCQIVFYQFASNLQWMDL